MFRSAQVSRRAVLKGLGVSLALPWLESLRSSALAAPVAAGGVAGTPPKRMAFIFVPNGVHLSEWTPRTTGLGFQLTPILQPLAGVQEDILVLSGLTHDKGRANGDGPGDHARSASVFLTGAQPRKTSGANIRSGISVDQYAAQALGNATRFPSLQLACEKGRGAGNCDSGYSCAYSSNVSWAGEASPLASETNPRAVFDRLFASGNRSEADAQREQREALQKSILDYIADDAQRLKARLGRNDQRKLDEYLTGVREIERRLEHSERETVAGGMPSMKVPDGVPREYAEHVQLMSDMLVLAFQTDLTRIASFMFANAGSNRSYRNVEVSEGHHQLSHHGNDPQKLAKISRINRFHVSQLAYLLERLKSIREGEGTLLDNCMIVYGSGLSDGNRHNNENLPVLLAGRGGGTIDTGRHVRYQTETPMCNLFLSLLDRFGSPAPFLGDSTGLLPNLQL